MMSVLISTFYTLSSKLCYVKLLYFFLHNSQSAPLGKILSEEKYFLKNIHLPVANFYERLTLRNLSVSMVFLKQNVYDRLSFPKEYTWERGEKIKCILQRQCRGKWWTIFKVPSFERNTKYSILGFLLFKILQYCCIVVCNIYWKLLPGSQYIIVATETFVC